MSKLISQEIWDKVVEMYQNGMGLTQISNSLNGEPCRPTIRKYLKKHGIYRDPNYYCGLSYEECLDIAQLYKDGKVNEIYLKYPHFKTESNIKNLVNHKMKIYRKDRTWTDEEEEYLIENYNKKSFDELINYYNQRHSKYGIEQKAIKLGLSRDRSWSKEEDEILINNYSNVDMDTMLKLLPNRTHQAITTRAKLFKITSFYNINKFYTEEENNYILKNYKYKTDCEIAEYLNRPIDGVQRQRRLLGIYIARRDYSSYSNFNQLFRIHSRKWREKSIKACEGKCILTGSSENINVHHLYGFNVIMIETFEKLEEMGLLKSEFPSDYTKEELQEIINIFLSINEQYPLGVCIREDIHMLFHNIYGRGNNSEKQWNKFVEDFKNGLYNDKIKI